MTSYDSYEVVVPTGFVVSSGDATSDSRSGAEGLVAAAFAWGTLAAFSLVIGAVLALVFRISLRAIGLIMAFGGGVLISAVSFDLVEEAVQKSSGDGWVVAGFFTGCLVFFGGDWLIDRSGGS